MIFGVINTAFEMTEAEYYEKSLTEGLPKRCPILNYCARRACTLVMFGGKDSESVGDLVSDGTLPRDYNKKEVPIVGELPGMMGKPGSHFVRFEGMCPEVNLFDRYHAFDFAKGRACSEGSSDTETGRTTMGFRHFSECGEYNSLGTKGRGVETRQLLRLPRGSHWSKLRRQLGMLQSQLASAKAEPEFQAVGLLCREILVTLMQALHNVDLEHVNRIEGKSLTDAKGLMEVYLAKHHNGGSNATLRKQMNASFDLANELQHKRTATRSHAFLCAEATEATVRIMCVLRNT
jgi:hypothetical protein